MAQDDSPNLNSPPGMPPPHSLPSATAIDSLRTTGQNHPEAPTALHSPSPQQNFVYWSCAAITVAAPLVMLIPPRKFDPYTFGLGLAWCGSAGVVLEHHTGHSLLWHVGSLLPSAANAQRRSREAEERAEEERQAKARDEARRRGISTMQVIREEKARRERGEVPTDQQSLVAMVREKEEARKRQKERGLVSKLWMGREGDDWIEKRAREEREAFEEGKGYGELITDHIKEALGFHTANRDNNDDGGSEGNSNGKEG